MNRGDFDTFDGKDENNRRRGEIEPEGEGEAQRRAAVSFIGRMARKVMEGTHLDT